MTADTIGALSDVRYRNSDELFRFRWQCAIRKYGLTKGLECSLRGRPQFAALARKVL